MTDETSTAPVMSYACSNCHGSGIGPDGKPCPISHMPFPTPVFKDDAHAPVMSLDELVAIEGYADEYGTVTDEMLTKLFTVANAHLNAPTPDVVGGDVVAVVDRRERQRKGYVETETIVRLTSCGVGMPTGTKLYAAQHVQGDAVVTALRECADVLREMRIAFPDPDRQVYRSAGDALAKLDAALAAQPKGDDVVRYCPECSSIGDVPPGARDCCPDGSAARLIPRHIARAAHRDFHHAIQALPAEQTMGEPVAYRYALESGKWTVFISKARAKFLADQGATVEPLYTAQPKPVQTRGDGVVEAMISAAISLIRDAEEYETADGLMNAAQLHLWHALEDAIEKVGPADISNSAPRQAVPDGWQPIETAPRTGRQMILLLTPSGWPQVAWSNTWWTSGFSVENKPTHWMPIPAAPSAGRMGVES